jgi:hypothetical protein
MFLDICFYKSPQVVSGHDIRDDIQTWQNLSMGKNIQKCGKDSKKVNSEVARCMRIWLWGEWVSKNGGREDLFN